jgi:hypothetical protein
MRGRPIDGKLRTMLLTFSPIAISLRGVGFSGRGSRMRDVVTRKPGWRVHPAPPPLSGAAARAAAS